MLMSGIKRPLKNFDGLITALAAARRRVGLNQKALAARVGTDQSYVSKVERGAVDPQTSTLIELARALGLELMLVPRQLVPAVQALQREIAPDPRNAPSKIDQDLLRLSRHARALVRRYPTLPALSEVATAADELRIARVDESSSAHVRPLIDGAEAIISNLRRFPSDRPDIERSRVAADAAHGLIPITRTLKDLRNQWVHREAPSASLPAYRLGDDDA
jgi:transcriptional regulator with XRE-family HTH domain